MANSNAEPETPLTPHAPKAKTKRPSKSFAAQVLAALRIKFIITESTFHEVRNTKTVNQIDPWEIHHRETRFFSQVR